ncbi:MAG: DAK2 domain-containing protein [Anaerolineae bacterium]|nr:DAK2 domain-containing protein [Anaerolineae bacterium]
MEANNAASQNPTTTCNGQDLKQLAQAGLAWLEQNYEMVNALNVFPVPDGDTGTNMLLTMRSAYEEIARIDEAHIGQIAQRLYTGALMGARGNSGVILSQLWRGFAKGIENRPTLDTKGLLNGLQEATRTAYQAVQEPVEGTMLTVAREVSEEAELICKETDDLMIVLDRIVTRGHESVQRTPHLLKVLADAGVVDSGGMGLMCILEGMLRYTRGEELVAEVPFEKRIEDLHSALEPDDEEGYGYDVQYLIKGEGMNVEEIRSHIESLGWSAVIAGDESIIKVHVHVHNPGEAVGYGADQGVLLDVVVENMQEQYEEFVHERGGPTMGGQAKEEAIEAPEIEAGTIAAVTVTPGNGLTRIFFSLGAGQVVAGGQTMNPSTKDLLEAINSLPTDKVIVLPNNKNIILSARQAAKQAEDKHVRVVETRTIPQGISALLSLDPYGDLDEISEAMKEAATYVQTGEITISTRNARIDGLKVKKGQVIGLHNDKLVVAGDSLDEVILGLLVKMEAQDMELITLYYGNDVKKHDAENLVSRLEELYPDHEIELRFGGQKHYFYILSVE